MGYHTLATFKPLLHGPTLLEVCTTYRTNGRFVDCLGRLSLVCPCAKLIAQLFVCRQCLLWLHAVRLFVAAALVGVHGWSRVATGDLIELFRCDPCLWHIKHKDYKNRTLKHNSLCFSSFSSKSAAAPIIPNKQTSFVLSLSSIAS